MTEMYMRFETIDQVAADGIRQSTDKETHVETQAQTLLRMLPDGWQSTEGQEAMAAAQMNQRTVEANALIGRNQVHALQGINMHGRETKHSIAGAVQALMG